MRVRNNKKGTTLVEMVVTLALITILFGMAASTLSAATGVFVKVQKQQYAQSILDTVMTELRSLTEEDAVAYVKIYENGEDFSGKTGKTSGSALEFVNTEGYAALVCADGCEETDLYIGEQKTGTEDAVPVGQLFVRYYLRSESDNSYNSEKDGKPAARALAKAYPAKFYMGNYLKITFSYINGENEGDEVTGVKAEVALYEDENCTQKVASESEMLDFRYKLVRKDTVTAK